MIQVAYAAIWWLILAAAGLIAFPLVSRVCGGLQDRGYCISKVLGLLLVTYFSWILASARVIEFGCANIAVSVALLLALSLYLGRKHLSPAKWPLRSMLLTEAVFSAAFVLFLIYVYRTPDIYFAHSEDFMDYGFLQSILRSDFFPPADPWLAGESVPYYYGGHLISAVVTRLSGVPAATAYNLAVAVFFALAVVAAFGLGYNLTRRYRYGLAAAFFVCVVGFLSGTFQLAAFFLQHSFMGYHTISAPNAVEWFASYDFVSANWLIEGAALRNPFYASMVGNLHADVMDIPFQLMLIALVLAQVRGGEPAAPSPRSDTLLRVFIVGLSLGALLFVSTWSYPTYLLLLLLGGLLVKLKLGGKAIAGTVVLSLLLYLPYHLSRGAGGIKGIGIVADRTELLEFIEVFALFLFVIASVLYLLLRRRPPRGRLLAAGALAAAAAAAVGFLFDFQLILLLIPLILVPACFMLRSREGNETRFVLSLVLTAALVVLACEVFYIDDPLSPPFERYNTLAKFYLQVWVLLAVASAYGLSRVLGETGRRTRAVWGALVILLVAASLIQPVGLAANWTGTRHDYFGVNRGTLDGLAYLERVDSADYEAIRWLNENVAGGPVILEAPGTSYEYTSRVSTLTGLPTVVGWTIHEVMWRGSWGDLPQREQDVDAIYSNPDRQATTVLLTRYNVKYVYFGNLERERYGAPALLKFTGQPQRYREIFRDGDVTIFEVLPL